MIRLAALALALSAGMAVAPVAGQAQGTAAPKNYYPTSARADYVIGCLAANGFNRLYLEKCSCGIDTIANLLPYKDYVEAETVLSLQQAGLGERAALFRSSPIAVEELNKLHQAEAEVLLRCR